MEKQISNQIQKLLRKKDYHKVIKTFQGDVNELINLLSTNKNCKDALLILQILNKDINDYPNLLQRFKKKNVRFMKKKYEWELSELFLRYDKEMLAYYCEDLFFDKKINESLSIIRRNKLEEFILKKEVLEVMHEEFEFKNNRIIDGDYFGPTSNILGDDCINLQQFDISKEDIVYVDTMEKIQEMKDYFEKEQIKLVGFDGENGPNFIPRTINTQVILQVATLKRIFILDIYTIKNIDQSFDQIKFLFEDFHIIKLGLGFKDDLKAFLQNFSNEQISLRNYIDIMYLYNHVTGFNTKGLKDITEKIFKKQFCKIEQMSCWIEKPLRQAQLHYASLDAYILLQIYQKLKEQSQEWDDVIIELTDQFLVKN